MADTVTDAVRATSQPSDHTSPCAGAPSQPSNPTSPRSGTAASGELVVFPSKRLHGSFNSTSIANESFTSAHRTGSSNALRRTSSTRHNSMNSTTLPRSRSGRNSLKAPGRDRVRAVVRVRPFLHKEREAARKSGHPPLEPCVALDGATVTVVNPATGQREAFLFDHCFDAASTQEDICAALGRPAVENALAGYNSCIFSYGQTNSGKTYTMLGSDAGGGGVSPLHRAQHAPTPQQDADAAAGGDDDRMSTPRSVGSGDGIVAHVIEDLFAAIDADASPTKMYQVTCSFMEIYCESVRDLLDAGGGGFQEGLKVRNHPMSGPFVEGLTSMQVTSKQHLARLITRGSRERITCQTHSNDRSSRSHAVVQITLTQTEVWDAKQNFVSTTTSRLNLVDLAGSERLTSQSYDHQMSETASINLSLTTLRRVIDALMENARKASHKTVLPPYRESKLTWLLSESLGGNSKTVMIGTVSPHPHVVEETLNTLKYTLKAKGIVNLPTRNQGKHVTVIKSLKSEIASLRAQLEGAGVATAGKVVGGGLPFSLNLASRQLVDTHTQTTASDACLASPRSAGGSPWWHGRHGSSPGLASASPNDSPTEFAVTVHLPLRECEAHRARLTAAIASAFGVSTDAIADVTFTDDTEGPGTIVMGNATMPDGGGLAAVSVSLATLTDLGFPVLRVQTAPAAAVRRAVSKVSSDTGSGGGVSAQMDIAITLDDDYQRVGSSQEELAEAVARAMGLPAEDIQKLSLARITGGTVGRTVVTVQVPGGAGGGGGGGGVTVFNPQTLRDEGFSPVAIQAVPCSALQEAVGRVLQQQQQQHGNGGGVLSDGNATGGAARTGRAEMELVAVRRENAAQERRIVQLHSELTARQQSEEARHDTARDLRKELESVCAALREKNRLNADLQAALDVALSKEASVQRLYGALLSDSEDAVRREADALRALHEHERRGENQDKRLRGLTTALEEKIAVTDDLQAQVDQLQEHNQRLVLALRSRGGVQLPPPPVLSAGGAGSTVVVSPVLARPPAAAAAAATPPRPTEPPPANETQVHTTPQLARHANGSGGALDGSGPATPPPTNAHAVEVNLFGHSPSSLVGTAGRPGHGTGTRSATRDGPPRSDANGVLTPAGFTDRELASLVDDDDPLAIAWQRGVDERVRLAEARYEKEKECRAKLGEERRRLVVERDQLAKAVKRLTQQLQAKGYRVSGAGDRITAMMKTDGLTAPNGWATRLAGIDQELARAPPTFEEGSAGTLSEDGTPPLPRRGEGSDDESPNGGGRVRPRPERLSFPNRPALRQHHPVVVQMPPAGFAVAGGEATPPPLQVPMLPLHSAPPPTLKPTPVGAAGVDIAAELGLARTRRRAVPLSVSTPSRGRSSSSRGASGGGGSVGRPSSPRPRPRPASPSSVTRSSRGATASPRARTSSASNRRSSSLGRATAASASRAYATTLLRSGYAGNRNARMAYAPAIV